MTIHLCSPPGGSAAEAVVDEQPTSILTLLPVGFTKLMLSPASLVRSYRTVSPLPVTASGPSAVCFLWHFPASYLDWPLASTVFCGAPTFLDAAEATPRPSGQLTRR